MKTKNHSMVLPGMFGEPAAAKPTPAATTWADVTNAAQRPSVSGLAEGKRRRDRGLAKAESNPALERFAELARRAWDTAISRNEYVTSDHLWAVMDLADVEVPKRAMVIGAIIRASAARREVVATGQFVKTSRAAGHARPVAVWKSMVFR